MKVELCSLQFLNLVTVLCTDMFGAITASHCSLFIGAHIHHIDESS